MAVTTQCKVDLSPAGNGIVPVAGDRPRWTGADACRGHHQPFPFAAGFSRQPLPEGNRFAKITNADGPGVKATDATVCRGLELAILRPETLEPERAKLPPAANLFCRQISTLGGACIGSTRITNGIKQPLPGAALPGGEIFSALNPDDDRLSPRTYQEG